MRRCTAEAITNATAHAFCADRAVGTISVSAELALDGLTVTVNDDGLGFRPCNESLGLGIGLRAINELTDWMWVGNSATGGTEIRMAFAHTAPALPADVDPITERTADRLVASPSA